MDYQQEIIERIKQDDKYLMYVADLLIKYDSNRNHGNSINVDGKSYPFKPLWKGHAQFITGICKWWNDKHYLTPKQHDTLVKTIEKYMDRVSTIFDILSGEVDNTTGSDCIPIFNMDEFDAKCPNCGSRDFKIPNPVMDMTYKCTSCGFVATYIQDEPDDDGNQAGQGFRPPQTVANADPTKSDGFVLSDEKIMELMKDFDGSIYGDSQTTKVWKMMTDVIKETMPGLVLPPGLAQTDTRKTKVSDTAKKEDENEDSPF